MTNQNLAQYLDKVNRCKLPLRAAPQNQINSNEKYYAPAGLKVGYFRYNEKGEK